MIFNRTGNFAAGFCIYVIASANALEFQPSDSSKIELMREFDLTVEAIEKVLIYFRRNSPLVLDVGDDVKFAIQMAKSNFRWIIDQIRSRIGGHHVAIEEKLTAMVRTSDEILEMSNKTNSPWLDRKFWASQPGDITYGHLIPHPDHLLFKFESCRQAEVYLMRVMESSGDSDFCMADLFKSECNVTNYCWSAETSGNSHSGYKTSHCLIYLQAAYKLRCDEKNEKKFSALKERKRTLCQRMLSEATELRKYLNVLVIQDLYLEQIALCGYEGFGEFGPADWRKEVRNLQNEDGCFGHHIVSVPCSFWSSYVLGVHKRRDFALEGCHTHVTAVALAAMAFHLRVIQNSLPPDDYLTV